MGGKFIKSEHLSAPIVLFWYNPLWQQNFDFFSPFSSIKQLPFIWPLW